jgi:putative protease
MSSPEQPIPELLAPSGGLDALRAAVANGADAVYLGVDKLNARRGAQNFTLEALPDVCRYAHVHGVRVYLTANVVVLPAELDEALALIDEAWAAGVDAVILQDLGLVRTVRLALPHVRIHAFCPDAVDTAMVESMADHGTAKALVHSGGRLLTVDQAADAAVGLVGSRRVVRTYPVWRGVLSRSTALTPGASARSLPLFVGLGRRVMARRSR